MYNEDGKIKERRSKDGDGKSRLVRLSKALQSVLDAMGCGDFDGENTEKLLAAKTAPQNYSLCTSVDAICEELERLIFIVRHVDKYYIDGIESPEKEGTSRRK